VTHSFIATALFSSFVVPVPGMVVSYMGCNELAFSVGDHVVVQFEGQSWDTPKVIGFVDNPKPCGFMFKLTRGDGVAIDDTNIGYIRVSDALGYECNTEMNYDENTGYFSVTFLSGNDGKDEDGYWVYYMCVRDTIHTQYPYRYKWADQWKAADRIKPGVYEDIIPVWKTTTENKPYPGGWLALARYSLRADLDGAIVCALRGKRECTYPNGWCPWLRELCDTLCKSPLAISGLCWICSPREDYRRQSGKSRRDIAGHHFRNGC